MALHPIRAGWDRSSIGIILPAGAANDAYYDRHGGVCLLSFHYQASGSFQFSLQCAELRPGLFRNISAKHRLRL